MFAQAREWGLQRTSGLTYVTITLDCVNGVFNDCGDMVVENNVIMFLEGRVSVTVQLPKAGCATRPTLTGGVGGSPSDASDFFYVFGRTARLTLKNFDIDCGDGLGADARRGIWLEDSGLVTLENVNIRNCVSPFGPALFSSSSTVVVKGGTFSVREGGGMKSEGRCFVCGAFKRGAAAFKRASNKHAEAAPGGSREERSTDNTPFQTHNAPSLLAARATEQRRRHDRRRPLPHAGRRLLLLRGLAVWPRPPLHRDGRDVRGQHRRRRRRDVRCAPFTLVPPHTLSACRRRAWLLATLRAGLASFFPSLLPLFPPLASSCSPPKHIVQPPPPAHPHRAAAVLKTGKNTIGVTLTSCKFIDNTVTADTGLCTVLATMKADNIIEGRSSSRLV